MKKIIAHNIILIFIQLICIIPYNYFFGHFSSQLSQAAYIGVIAYALVCGITLALMDLSSRRVNMGLAGYYLIFGVINVQYSLFQYGSTVFMIFLMLGVTMTAALKKAR